MPADCRRVPLAGVGLASAWLLTACMAWPGLPQPVADPWADALQACALGDDALSLGTGATPGDAMCTRALALGQGLHCLARQLPALPSAQARFTPAGLLEFQDCLQPLADGLVAGRLGQPLEIDLALRQCVLHLDRAPAGPRPRPPWWQDSPVAQFPPAPNLPALAQARLPVATHRSWPRCDELAALALPAARPVPALPPAVAPVVGAVPLRPAALPALPALPAPRQAPPR